MMNPVNHARSVEGSGTKVEPYVVAADVYAIPVARRPWRLDVVHGLGGVDVPPHRRIAARVTAEVDWLRFTPCLPTDWPSFTIHYRYRETRYDIAVRQTLVGAGAGLPMTSVTVDGVLQPDGLVHLIDDRAVHQVSVDVHAADK